MELSGHGFNPHSHSAARAVLNEPWASICAVLSLREMMVEAYLCVLSLSATQFLTTGLLEKTGACKPHRP